MNALPERDFLNEKHHIGVIGMGYVGLPLAVAFAGKWDVVGYDIDPTRIYELLASKDVTGEVSSDQLKNSTSLHFTNDTEMLRSCNIFIVTVPTPIDEAMQPDLTPLLSASRTIAQILKPGDFVIYESTVYPGVTRGECVEVLETISGLQMLPDDESSHEGMFYVGYSPERINPGDRSKKINDITKVTSGCTKLVGQKIDALYGSVIDAGTHLAPTIEIAEAAKVIENTQRDVNIALMNELAILFGKMDIDMSAVLAAASTKWNFLSFSPGLVGGHCIGVDPYYLTHAAAKAGHHPEIILAGRRINDSMPSVIAERVVKSLLEAKINVIGAKVLVLGLTFKEDCPDVRNSKVFDLIDRLKGFHCDVECYDPYVCKNEIPIKNGTKLVCEIEAKRYDGIVIAVAHSEFVVWGLDAIRAFGRENHVLFDVKNAFKSVKSAWRL